MTSHKHSFIFVHIPKTAGTSVAACLRPYCETYIKHHHILDRLPPNPRSYYKFCVSRNPWDRCVSRYHYLKQEPWFPRGDFSDFIINKNNKFSYGSIRVQQIKNEYNPPLEGFIKLCDKFPFDEQLDWVSDNEGNILMDFFIKFETLQKDFNIVCDKIGIPKQKLPHTNKTNHKHYTEYFDNVTRELVAEKYAKDIEYFGYEFGK
tara:strand:+ start:115 stop:729 length:615 start_codon:yes stop_codon:yes gene_type:complete